MASSQATDLFLADGHHVKLHGGVAQMEDSPWRDTRPLVSAWGGGKFI
jgi:hypothetical protein